jgi:hypothetical protein
LNKDEDGARPRSPGREFSVVVGIFGAVTFVALVLVMQNPTNFKVAQIGLVLNQTGAQEFNDLVIYLSAVCIISAFSVLASACVGAGLVRFDSLLGWFGYALGGMTIVGFAVAVWVLVSSLGDFVAYVTLGLIATLAVVFFLGLLRGLPSPRTKA